MAELAEMLRETVIRQAGPGVRKPIFCPVNGSQMLPGHEMVVGSVEEAVCYYCACWVRRIRLGMIPDIPEITEEKVA